MVVKKAIVTYSPCVFDFDIDRAKKRVAHTFSVESNEVKGERT